MNKSGKYKGVFTLLLISLILFSCDQEDPTHVSNALEAESKAANSDGSNGGNLSCDGTYEFTSGRINADDADFYNKFKSIGFEITLSEGATKVSWKWIGEECVVGQALLKGGRDNLVYDLASGSGITPLNNGGKRAALSNLTICYTIVPCPKPEDEGCSMSQGYYFSKPQKTWSTVTVGNVTLTFETRNQANFVFQQAATIKLSSSTVAPGASVWADVMIIENHFNSNSLSTTVAPGSAVHQAGGRIGDWVNTHHCE